MIADCAVMAGLFGKKVSKAGMIADNSCGLNWGIAVCCQKKYSKAGIIADKF